MLIFEVSISPDIKADYVQDLFILFELSLTVNVFFRNLIIQNNYFNR